MAFLGYDPAKEDDSYSVSGAYRGLRPEVDVPLVDPHAWERNRKFRGVYNKLDVALSQGIEADLVGSAKQPSAYPVIVRPVYNLWGMGHLAEVVNGANEFNELDCSGHFWTPFIEGIHRSWDFAVVDGEPVWVIGFYGSKKPGMRFDYWALIENNRAEDSKMTQLAQQWIRNNLSGYTGMVNVETIGSTIIECQLRIGDVIVFMACRELMKAIIGLYEKGSWDYEKNLSQFHILCIWVKRGGPLAAYESDKVSQCAQLLNGNARSWSIELADEWKGDPIGHKSAMLIGAESWWDASVLRSKICEASSQFYY